MARPPLTREAILDAAVGLLDQDGLPGLSMRRLGAALGVEAMSLYHHVPSKAALLDGIHEQILLALPPPPRARTWQAYARHQAHALHAALRAHPHAVPLFATRPAATPAATARLERYLAVLVGAGFAPVDALSVIQLLAQLVVGHAMWTTAVEVVAVGAAPARARPDPLERAVARWDPDRELALGIDALIAGFARLRA